MRVVGTVIVLIVLNMATALGVVYNQYQKRIYGMQVSQTEADRDRKVDKWAQLLIEYATWSSNSRIEKIARERLGMRYEYNNYVFLRLE